MLPGISPKTVWFDLVELSAVRRGDVRRDGSSKRFQNLDESNRLWSSLIGKTYADFLSPVQYGDLARLVQARHVLAHRDGLVDPDYVARSGDQRYAAGQRLVVTAAEVRRLAELVEVLSASLSAAQKP